MNNQEMANKIFELEAQINGLMIYIASKEAGVELDPESPEAKSFFKTNVMRDYDTRQRSLPPSTEAPSAMAADGYWDTLATARIPGLVRKLQEKFGK
ncbi:MULTISPECIES: hypothetical protein [unclassified Rhizobium]|uniref:hypothetical protein n=1 Tax=unclassified Rhizobium TaxID=2613769 RepID=UPI001AE14001|nr:MULTISPECIES: hypothetical protein [unclassified Rhizobium]MBP2459599.1 hypothetical protein [Rhizobium sp. PvP014]MBP2531893.1 hypothetical protein [Rhizobium sp. PvP099]